MGRINNLQLPRQRLAYSAKTKEWRKNNVDFADKHSFYHNESVRQTLRNKIINFNLYNGIVDIRDIKDTINPYKVDANYIPDNIPHNPIAVPKIDLLVGEEAKRRFDWSVIVTNENAITKKEEDKKKFLEAKIAEFLQANYKDEELEEKMKGLEKYMKYEYQDVREKLGNQLLRHYWHELEFTRKFTDAFKQALISGEEIAQVDIVHDEPTMDIMNGLKVHAVRSGNSNKIEDCDIIVYEDHWSPGKIIDTFHDQLKEKDIDYILEYSTQRVNDEYSDDDNNHVLFRDGLKSHFLDGYLAIANINGHQFSSDYTDENGNIRVLRVYWKSQKKVQKIKYYDEFGEVQHKFMSEEYIPNKDLGEESKTLWINESWEGTKIGKDIYLNMRPRQVQFTRMNNPSKTHHGFIGEIYNTNQGRAVSLMDRMKNYQYLYDVIWDRLLKSISTNYGKIMELDISKVPDNWEIDKWMHFAVVNKIAVVDSFKEGNKGAATGKLAGGFTSHGGRTIDMETGAYIQQHINLLQFIKDEMGEISGVSTQRQGQISNRETVGGVERAVTQSSHITEYWFQKHESFKVRVLNAFLQCAKIALKGKNFKAQYILDDQTLDFLNYESDQVEDCDFGVLVSSNHKIKEFEQNIKEYSHAFLQNGGRLSTVMDIMFSPSIMDMRRKIEIAEDEQSEREAQQAQEQLKAQQEQIAQEQQLEQMKLQLEDLKNQRDNQTKLAIAGMNSTEDVGNDTDPIDWEKLNLEKTKHQDDIMHKMKVAQDQMKMHKDNLAVKKKQVNKKPTKST